MEKSYSKKENLENLILKEGKRNSKWNGSENLIFEEKEVLQDGVLGKSDTQRGKAR